MSQGWPLSSVKLGVRGGRGLGGFGNAGQQGAGRHMSPGGKGQGITGCALSPLGGGRRQLRSGEMCKERSLANSPDC